MMKNSCMHAAIRELGTLFNEGAVGMLSDGQLLDRFVERRDASAFEAIVERYGPLVWGVCRRVLRDHHDAEDAFQATFLVLARKAASVMPREKLGNWLYGVAFQTAMNARATRAKRRVRERPAWEMTEPEAVPDEHADELLSRLDREVARLPEKYRLPIVLCELEGKTHRQAAEQLGWPVGTVSGRLSRARVMLASRLSRPGTPLTVGALGVLLAHDAAWAGVPPELVRSTAQAASLSMAGKAVAAGVVSAEVAALTGEVLKTMLINKLKIVTAMLLVAFALGTAGSGLAYRAQATATTDQEEGSEEPNGQPKLVEAAKRGCLATGPAAAEDGNALTGSQPTLRCGGYIFTASPTGSRAIAYNPVTREEKAVRLNATKEQPIKVKPIDSGEIGPVVALRLQGPRITRVAVFDLKSGNWLPLDLVKPIDGVVSPSNIDNDGVAYDLGRYLYTFSAKTGKWDCLDVQAIPDEDGAGRKPSRAEGEPAERPARGLSDPRRE